jgi:hypothetical protein
MNLFVGQVEFVFHVPGRGGYHIAINGENLERLMVTETVPKLE